MEILQALLVLLIILAPFVYYILIFIPQRLKKLEKSNVIFIPELKIYAVPIKVLEEIQNYTYIPYSPTRQSRVSTLSQRAENESRVSQAKVWVVKSVRPGLCDGSVAFVEMSHRAEEVKIVDGKKALVWTLK